MACDFDETPDGNTPEIRPTIYELGGRPMAQVIDDAICELAKFKSDNVTDDVYAGAIDVASNAVIALNKYAGISYRDDGIVVGTLDDAASYVKAKVYEYVSGRMIDGTIQNSGNLRIGVSVIKDDNDRFALSGITLYIDEGECLDTFDDLAPYGNTSTDDAIGTICHYNGLYDSIAGMVDRMPNDAGYLRRPDGLDEQEEILWMLLVLKFGDYGTSPRYGWISNPSEARTYVHCIVNSDILCDRQVEGT